MEKILKKISFISAIIFLSLNATAQVDSTIKLPTYRVAIFAPLYLDSVFSNSSYRYKSVPKFIVPAVEFVQGAQIALDSLKVSGANVQAYVYDSKAYTKSIPYLINSKQLDNVKLIIGSVRDADYRQLADFALQKNIPFVSAILPNDGGVINNPFTIIMNSTLRAHCEGIYSYLLQNHGTDLIYLVRQKGNQEDKVVAYINAANYQDGKPLLNIETVNFNSAEDEKAFTQKLDSNRKNIIIGASFDEAFAKRLAIGCYNLSSSYPITLIGMPNWDGFNFLYRKNDFKDFPIHFTTPYFNSKWDDESKMLRAVYLSKYKIKPSDMAYKGYEAVTMFTKILTQYPNGFMNHINEKNAKVFCEYNFLPVLNPQTKTTDYFENKHLYFVKILNGSRSRAW